jgi:hypothetical protein
MTTLNLFAVLVALSAAGSSQAAQATEPTGTLTLACNGTAQTGDFKPEPTSVGIIINFAAQTIEGFHSDVNFQIVITDITETAITFAGSNLDPKRTITEDIHGTIDRVTGTVEAIYAGSPVRGSGKGWTMIYSLKCKPTQRMF